MQNSITNSASARASSRKRHSDHQFAEHRSTTDIAEFERFIRLSDVRKYRIAVGRTRTLESITEALEDMS